MISIIVPTYNEAKNIDKLIALISKNLPGIKYEIIIVDDNSPDGTGKMAEELSKKYPLRVIHRNKRLGLATAVIEGLRVAKGKLACVMDADLSHPPEEIAKMVNCLKKEGADIVVASRLAEGGKIEKWPPSRKFISFCAKLLARPLTNVKDPMSGFFIINKNVIENAQLNPLGYKILLEILVKGRYKKTVEHPFVFRNRMHGKTKLGGKTILHYFIHIIKLYYYSLFSKKYE